jgi:hypothetical protein
VHETLEVLHVAAQGNAHLMHPMLGAVPAYVTIGEICHVLREGSRIYREVLVVQQGRPFSRCRSAPRRGLLWIDVRGRRRCGSSRPH